MARNLGPQELDPLESAATPIMADKDVRDLTELRRRTAAYVNAGMPAGAAQRQAASDMAAGASLANNPRTKARHAAEQAAAEAAAAQAAAQEQAGIEAARPENQPRTPEELRAKGLFGQREPGVRGIDGLPVDTGAALTTEREAADYVTRPPLSEAERRSSQGGTVGKSPRDLAMNARGFYENFGDEDGSVAYSVAAPIGRPEWNTPGEPGRLGRRRDLEANWVNRDGALIRDANGAPIPKFYPKEVDSPTPGQAYVYAPTDLTQDYNRSLKREQQVIRMAKAAGMSPTEYYDKNKDSIGSLEGGGTRLGAGERLAVADARAQRAAKLEANRVQMQQNPFLTLGDNRLNEWQQFVLSQRLLGGSQKITDPNAVQATHNEQLNAIALQAMRNQGSAPISPGLQDAQAAVANAQATKNENELSEEDHAALERSRNGGKLPARSRAGQRILQKIASKFIGSYATDAEIGRAIAAAEDEGIDPAEAEAHFAPRRRSMWQWVTGS